MAPYRLRILVVLEGVGLWFVFVLLYITKCAFIFTRKIELVAMLLLLFWCIVTVNVLCFFLTVPCVGRQCVIVVFPDHTHLRFHY